MWWFTFGLLHIFLAYLLSSKCSGKGDVLTSLGSALLPFQTKTSGYSFLISLISKKCAQFTSPRKCWSIILWYTILHTRYCLIHTCKWSVKLIPSWKCYFCGEAQWFWDTYLCTHLVSIQLSFLSQRRIILIIICIFLHSQLNAGQVAKAELVLIKPEFLLLSLCDICAGSFVYVPGRKVKFDK